MPATNIFVVGANSGIARACLELWARSGARAYLVGRDPDRLDETAREFTAAGGELAGSESADFNSPDDMDAMVARGFAALGRVDVFFLATGTMPDHRVLEQAPENVDAVLRINLSIPARIVMQAANRFEHQRSGCLAALSSVAGDMGRRANYVYGASKAGLSTIMEGLDARFAGTAVRVLDIRPGPVRTPMTAHLRQGLFFADPEPVARRIVRCIRSGRHGRLYVPAYWRHIMSLLRNLPDDVRRRLRF